MKSTEQCRWRPYVGAYICASLVSLTTSKGHRPQDNPSDSKQRSRISWCPGHHRLKRLSCERTKTSPPSIFQQVFSLKTEYTAVAVLGIFVWGLGDPPSFVWGLGFLSSPLPFLLLLSLPSTAITVGEC